MPRNSKKQNLKASKKISVKEFKLGVLKNKFITPKKRSLSKVLAPQSVTSKAREILRDSIETCDAVVNRVSIDKKFCDVRGIQYVSELISQIISAKKIKLIDIYTPFGDCKLSFISTDNYFAKVKGVSIKAGTYGFLLDAIDQFKNRDTLINEIKKFLEYKIKDDFIIYIEKDINKTIYNTMREYMANANVNGMNQQIIYPKDYIGQKFKMNYKDAATLICGIFIAEMIRSAAKFIRSAFLNSDWPKTVEELRSKFLQSDKQGNEKFRNELMRKTSNYTKVLQKSLSTVSPFKKGQKKRFILL